MVEHEFDDVVVSFTSQSSVPRVHPFDFVAVDDVNSGTNFCGQKPEFARIILSVAVGVENPFILSGSDAAFEGSTVASIFGMGDDS